MTRVLFLPGDGCCFFYAGHCLYEEKMNPGLHEQFQCAVLAALDADFDDFVQRCERLSVQVETAGQIWNKQCEDVLGQHWPCVSYRADPEADNPNLCIYLVFDRCALRFPRCPGRCRHFRYGQPVAENIF
ncbi:MAG: hypothetical protein GX055_09225 [Desulfovibrionales bacterium]|nr:hypothetical protein [Desulfovibrionales bacterium]